ncbi:asparagine synthase [Carbonactinospora thermoautotrophica]|uniref:Asparagine synthase n=1 Tax=Carbonactinospora thermoautotrophica TaxID=1469144 RepID=A0A132N8R0_9ACTN|nr:asparagine synthase-related protein [Carbonactinospora thermoautotrophica]KWX02635.1 Asparagine synthase [Carbonactinospora thermoautotrophica]KWX03691.1 asparagine synthase [Carbonactinospora thermoautotrophica]KWX06406.1 asparagine synthase [Carbonactinospora thermoautotrophica]
MIKLRLTPYADTTWSWDGTRYTTAGRSSEITPFQHPMLEHLAVTDGTRTLLVFRERVAGRPPCDPATRPLSAADYDRARALAAQWPVDYVLVETAPRMPVRVTAGACGIAPLYLAHDASSLYGSWDMADLRNHITGLCAREAARLLIYRPRYGSETLFRGVHRLTERATAFYGGHLHLHYPEPALHGTPRKLAPDADVLGAFVQAIDNALDLRPLDLASTVFHLTGGFDSGTVATRAAQRYPGQVHTAALLIGGPGRAQQIRRRKEMRTILPFGERDDLVDAMQDAPLHPDCARVRGELISPYEEPLHWPFTRLAGILAGHGVRAVVTGLGGDEMVALSQEEYPHRSMGEITDALPWIGERARQALEYADDAIAPPAVVNSMTLLALETAAPVLLRAGIWPVHPFTDPGMVQLGEWLPMHWRELKQLQRRQLASLGLSTDVTQPVERESFAEVVQHTLTTHAQPLFARMLREGSALFDAGLVDPDGLRQAVTRVRDGRYSEDDDAKLLEVIHLHLATQAFL